MTGSYLHITVDTAQSAKREGRACGDVVVCERTAAATTVVLADGLGAGIKANVAATMACARLIELLRGGFSLRDSFTRLAGAMNHARTSDLPFAAFTVAQVLNDGAATVLTYETPAPLLVGLRRASGLPQRVIEADKALTGESCVRLEPGEGLLLVSDGVTQAGIGKGLRQGWGIEGLARYVNLQLDQGRAAEELPELIRLEALGHDGGRAEDDTTATLARCRPGKLLTVLTGPPTNRALDAEVVREFMAAPGPKAICGGVTSRIVAERLKKTLRVQEDSLETLAPPVYALDGVDLVAEGAVTLNQVYNVIDEDPALHEEESSVTRLCALLRDADRVDVLLGGALNPAGDHIAFRQKGIITRARIVPLLADKLRAMGKLVVVKKV